MNPEKNFRSPPPKKTMDSLKKVFVTPQKSLFIPIKSFYSTPLLKKKEKKSSVLTPLKKSFLKKIKFDNKNLSKENLGQQNLDKFFWIKNLRIVRNFG